MFCAYAQPDGCRRNVLFCQFLRRKLRVGGCIRVYNQTLHIGYISQQREYLQGINEAPGLLLSTLYLEGKYAARSFREVFLVECMIGMALQCRMIHPGYLWMLGEEVNDLEGILDMSFYSE